MSTVFKISSSWPGFPGIKRVMIFGDSYSSVRTAAIRLDSVEGVPSAEYPLGIPFPGNTWNEPGKPNWVGHLITKYSPPPRFIPDNDAQEEGYSDNALLVYDYALGGDTVAGVRRQIQSWFLPHVGKKPDWAPWNSNNSLFVTWVGINDCAYSLDHEGSMQRLFALQQELYDAGARNFLFIDIPPVHRSPAVPQHHSTWSEPYVGWNTALSSAITKFSAEHDDITALLYSAYHVFETFLEDPQTYGFKPNDIRKAGGAVWVDQLHPTSKVHDIVAHGVADFLGEVAKLLPTSEKTV